MGTTPTISLPTIALRHALLSVQNKAAVGPLAQALVAQGVVLYATSSTHAYLQEQNIPVRSVSDLIQQEPILGGRVKTLHPKLFAGILYRADEAEDVRTLEGLDMVGFDMVVVDVYDFGAAVADEADYGACIEQIDVGGISLLRAAAKNHAQVWVVGSRSSYDSVVAHLTQEGAISTKQLRQRAAAEAFAYSSQYDAQIHAYLIQANEEAVTHQPILPTTRQTLRYGENPHQAGYFYGDLSRVVTQEQGKPLSYNNVSDIDTGLRLAADLGEGAFVIIKHRNPCGVAVDGDCFAAYSKAWDTDTLSAFGGIFIYHGILTQQVAQAMLPNFFEVVAATGYEAAALSALETKPTRRVLTIQEWPTDTVEYRSALGGALVQEADRFVHDPLSWTQVTHLKPTDAMLKDLSFALCLAKWGCSNSIVLAKDQQALAISTGQTARIDALQMAIEKAHRAGLSLQGGVMASEAFFPFEDSVAVAQQAGVAAIVQPGGSIQDQRSIDYCNNHGVCMVFCEIRHFRH